MATDPIARRNIKAKKPVVHKLAYELRYHYGHTYLDRCGRILTLIERDHPQWMVDPSAVSPQGATIYNLELGSQFRFSSGSLLLTWEQPENAGDFTAEAWSG